jgi:hypothetical protein
MTTTHAFSAGVKKKTIESFVLSVSDLKVRWLRAAQLSVPVRAAALIPHSSTSTTTTNTNANTSTIINVSTPKSLTFLGFARLVSHAQSVCPYCSTAPACRAQDPIVHASVERALIFEKGVTSVTLDKVRNDRGGIPACAVIHCLRPRRRLRARKCRRSFVWCAIGGVPLKNHFEEPCRMRTISIPPSTAYPAPHPRSHPPSLFAL